MGFSTVLDSYLDTNTPQTPRMVYLVREQAGWNYVEAAEAIGVDSSVIASAEHGCVPMPDDVWRAFLSICGRRAFDND